MDVLAPILVIALVALVVTFVASPLRRGVSERARAAHEGLRADLEAAKISKYREIRDAEMDLRTGKLSDADWRELDRRLRAEAIEILHALDALGPADPDASREGADGEGADGEGAGEERGEGGADGSPAATIGRR